MDHDHNSSRSDQGTRSPTILIHNKAKARNKNSSKGIRDAHDRCSLPGVVVVPFGLQKVAGNVVEGNDCAVE